MLPALPALRTDAPEGTGPRGGAAAAVREPSCISVAAAAALSLSGRSPPAEDGGAAAAAAAADEAAGAETEIASPASLSIRSRWSLSAGPVSASTAERAAACPRSLVSRSRSSAGSWDVTGTPRSCSISATRASVDAGAVRPKYERMTSRDSLPAASCPFVRASRNSSQLRVPADSEPASLAMVT